MSYWKQIELWEGIVSKSAPDYPEWASDLLFVKITKDSQLVWSNKDGYGVLMLHDGAVFPAKIGQRIKLIIEVEDES